MRSKNKQINGKMLSSFCAFWDKLLNTKRVGAKSCSFYKLPSSSGIRSKLLYSGEIFAETIFLPSSILIKLLSSKWRCWKKKLFFLAGFSPDSYIQPRFLQGRKLGRFLENTNEGWRERKVVMQLLSGWFGKVAGRVTACTDVLCHCYISIEVTKTEGWITFFFL